MQLLQLSLEECLDFGCQRAGILLVMSFRVSTAIEQEQFKVPSDTLYACLFLHVAPERVSVVTVDLNLAEHGESNFVLVLHELLDF